MNMLRHLQHCAQSRARSLGQQLIGVIVILPMTSGETKHWDSPKTFLFSGPPPLCLEQITATSISVRPSSSPISSQNSSLQATASLCCTSNYLSQIAVHRLCKCVCVCVCVCVSE